MRIPVRSKLVISYLLISVLTAVFIYLLTYYTSEQRISALARDYQTSEMAQEVSAWYAAEGQWQGFGDYFKSLHPPPSERKAGAQSGSGGKRHGIVTSEGTALLRYLDFEPGDRVPQAHLAKALAVTYQGETIAWIIPPEATGLSLSSEFQVFLDNILDVLLIATCISVLISLLMGLVLARVLLKPVESLTRATSAIAAGDLSQQVPCVSDDEIGDLSRSFNKMSQDLGHADRQRRQLTADITHDLGTPVQVISGYIEMAQDGALPLDGERLETIAAELDHIQRLLKDMSLLAETDARTLSLHPAETVIEPLLSRVQRLYQGACEEKGISLSVECNPTLPVLELDEERMVQVLGNLVSNAMRYTPENGKILLLAKRTETEVTIEVEDNGSGIEPDDLSYIFDRFYRSDVARSGASGKMGLGLAISKGLVEMQGGKIGAQSDGTSGSRFIITFPL